MILGIHYPRNHLRPTSPRGGLGRTILPFGATIGAMILGTAIACLGCAGQGERSPWIAYCVGPDCTCEEDNDCVVARCLFEPSVESCGCCYYCRNGDPIRKDAWEALRAEWQELCGVDLCIDTDSDYDCWEWSTFAPVCIRGRCAAVLEESQEIFGSG